MSKNAQEQPSGEPQADQDGIQLLQQALLQNFAEAASSVLSQVAGTALEALPSALATATEAATLIRVELSGALEGLCEIALSEAMTAQFAALLTGEIPDPAAGASDELREAAAELVQQICGNAADRLRAAFGPLELKAHPAEREPAGYDANERHLLRLDRGADALELELHLLRLNAHAKPAAAAPPAQPAVPPAAASAAPSAALYAPPSPAPAQSSTRNLDLLLDIELGVTLRFGSRQMLLKDILELSSGSVVELDRRVEEPVDLLIDGRVIARGEVVLVEGNYGLRILQVATQGEKLAFLP